MSAEKREYIDISTGEVYDSAESALNAQRELQKQAEYERSNKNPEFIQLTKGVSPEVLAKIAGESAVAIQILMFFFKNMDDYNVIMVSQSVIAESVGVNTRSVARAIKVLENNGAIGIGKVGNANVYLINPHVAWQKRFDQRKTAILKANVILGKEESNRLQEKFGEVYDESRKNSLKIDHVATKIAVPKVEKPKEQTDETTLSVEKFDELEQEYEYSDSVLPEDVPPWEE